MTRKRSGLVALVALGLAIGCGLTACSDDETSTPAGTGGTMGTGGGGGSDASTGTGGSDAGTKDVSAKDATTSDAAKVAACKAEDGDWATACVCSTCPIQAYDCLFASGAASIDCKRVVTCVLEKGISQVNACIAGASPAALELAGALQPCATSCVPDSGYPGDANADGNTDAKSDSATDATADVKIDSTADTGTVDTGMETSVDADASDAADSSTTDAADEAHEDDAMSEAGDDAAAEDAAAE